VVPELEEHYFTLDRRVVKLISGGSFGAEARSGLAGFIGGEGTESGQEQQAGQDGPRSDVLRSHAAEL